MKTRPIKSQAYHATSHAAPAPVCAKGEGKSMTKQVNDAFLRICVARGKEPTGYMSAKIRAKLKAKVIL